MTVNLLKTKTCFNKKFRLDNSSVPILFGNKPIEECDEYKYLGIVFSTQGNRFKSNYVRKREKPSAQYLQQKKLCVMQLDAIYPPTSV